jgi:hypothetical protein
MEFVVFLTKVIFMKISYLHALGIAQLVQTQVILLFAIPVQLLQKDLLMVFAPPMLFQA